MDNEARSFQRTMKLYSWFRAVCLLGLMITLPVRFLVLQPQKALIMEEYRQVRVATANNSTEGEVVRMAREKAVDEKLAAADLREGLNDSFVVSCCVGLFLTWLNRRRTVEEHRLATKLVTS